MQQISELFNVNHFIVSQVNPHAAIFSSMGWKASIYSNPFYRTMVGCARFLKDQCRDWVKNIVGLLVFRSDAPEWSSKRGLALTLIQDYEGRESDVTIMPWVGHITAFQATVMSIRVRGVF
jgi:TAG lipase/steryl ester hydrolase/phospholipase A2/LPA acyltransferase